MDLYCGAPGKVLVVVPQTNSHVSVNMSEINEDLPCLLSIVDQCYTGGKGLRKLGPLLAGV